MIVGLQIADVQHFEHLMDPRFLEYVLVHEMTHLWENGHGEDFQRRMSAYLPQWRQLRRELNRHVVL